MFVEIFRAKDDRFLGPFTMAQALSVVMIVIGATLMMRFKARPLPAEAPGT
jgi:prolipoprotein diacylglyceryltransferase